MSAFTEVAIFRKCVEEPILLNLQEMGLKNVTSPPSASGEGNEKELLQKAALKLIHMCWSGFTKYIR